MLFTVIRSSWPRSVLTPVAFRNTGPTVSSLLATRSFLTTAQLLKAETRKVAIKKVATKKVVKAVKTAKPAASKAASTAAASKKVVKKEKKSDAAKEEKKEQARVRKEKATARKEKALELEKAKALRRREREKLRKERTKAKAKEQANKELDNLAKKNARPPFSRPPTAYNNFVSQSILTLNLPKGTATKFSLAQASKTWSNLSEEEKKKYATDPKELDAYREKFAAWKATLTLRERSMRKHIFKRSHVGSYNVFIMEHYPKKLEGQTFGEAAAAVRKKFEALSEEEKAEYQKKADVLNVVRKEAKAAAKAKS